MAWGIELKTTIFIPRITKDEIENTISENEDTMQFIKEKILMFASANPKDIINSQQDAEYPETEYLSILHTELNELLEEYKRCTSQNALLYLMKEEMNKVKNT